MRPLLYLCLFALALPDAAGEKPPAATDEARLRQIEKEWTEAYLKRDPRIAEKFTAPSFILIGPDGNTATREDYLKSLTGPTKFTAFDLQEMVVRVFGDSAVVTGTLDAKIKVEDRDMDGSFAFTDVFVRQDGDWKAVSAQVTRIVKR